MSVKLDLDHLQTRDSEVDLIKTYEQQLNPMLPVAEITGGSAGEKLSDLSSRSYLGITAPACS